MSPKKLLDALFDADKKLRDAEEHLLAHPSGDELSQLLHQATEQALSMEDAREGAARLIRLCDLCAQVQGPRMADTLIHILNQDDPQVRVAAGEALRDFAYDRYAEVARAIERAFEGDQDGPALEELPWILAEIAEPSAVPLIARALEHPRATVVASAIEALSELGDPEAAPLLKPLLKDRRTVELEEGETTYSTTVGELAEEALAELAER
jgi:HEAT repeat protein